MLNVINRLEKLIDDEVLDLLEESDCIIAGGALTSILTGSEVNDIDVYFKTRDSFTNLIKDVINSETVDYFQLIFLSYTAKAVTFKQRSNGLVIQFIYTDFYPSAQDIFNDFDFTINMFAYDLQRGVIEQHKDALIHLAQRNIVVNTNTRFPLASVLRLEKYKSRGFSISKQEHIKLLLALSKINFTSYEQVFSHIGGLYGESYLDYFDESEPFDLNKLIAKLGDIDTDEIPKKFNKATWVDLVNNFNHIQPTFVTTKGEGYHEEFEKFFQSFTRHL